MNIQREFVKRITVNKVIVSISLLYTTLSIVSAFLIYYFRDTFITLIGPEGSTTLSQNIFPLFDIFLVFLISNFILMTLLVPLVMRLILNHFKSQLIPLHEQLQHFMKGEFSFRRHMRASDEFLPIMHKIHKLGHKLQEIDNPEKSTQ